MISNFSGLDTKNGLYKPCTERRKVDKWADAMVELNGALEGAREAGVTKETNNEAKGRRLQFKPLAFLGGVMKVKCGKDEQVSLAKLNEKFRDITKFMKKARRIDGTNKKDPTKDDNQSTGQKGSQEEFFALWKLALFV